MPSQSLLYELLLLRVNFLLQLIFIFANFIHIELQALLTVSGPIVVVNRSTFIDVRRLLLDAVHIFDHFNATLFFSLSPQFRYQLLLRHVSPHLLLRLLICLLFLLLILLLFYPSLLLELGTTCELIPHFSRTLHKVLILDLLEPAFIDSQPMATIRALLLPIFIFYSLLYLFVNLLRR